MKKTERRAGKARGFSIRAGLIERSFVRPHRPRNVAAAKRPCGRRRERKSLFREAAGGSFVGLSLRFMHSSLPGSKCFGFGGGGGAGHYPRNFASLLLPLLSPPTLLVFHVCQGRRLPQTPGSRAYRLLSHPFRAWEGGK